MTELPSLKYRDQHSQKKQQHWRSEASSLFGESFFCPVPAARRGTFRMCWGSRHFATTWGDDYIGMPLVRRFLCGCWDFSQSQNLNFTCGGFCLCLKISLPFFCCHFLLGKKQKKQFITKPGGDFSCCWRSFPWAFPVSIFDTAAVVQKKKHQKITIKKHPIKSTVLDYYGK